MTWYIIDTSTQCIIRQQTIRITPFSRSHFSAGSNISPAVFQLVKTTRHMWLIKIHHKVNETELKLQESVTNYNFVKQRADCYINCIRWLAYQDRAVVLEKNCQNAKNERVWCMKVHKKRRLASTCSRIKVARRSYTTKLLLQARATLIQSGYQKTANNTC